MAAEAEAEEVVAEDRICRRCDNRCVRLSSCRASTNKEDSAYTFLFHLTLNDSTTYSSVASLVSLAIQG